MSSSERKRGRYTSRPQGSSAQIKDRRERLFITHYQRDLGPNLPLLGIARGRQLLRLERTQLAQGQLIAVDQVGRSRQASPTSRHHAVRNHLRIAEVMAVEGEGGVQYQISVLVGRHLLLPRDVTGQRRYLLLLSG